ncbi:hypothetical protein [Gloeocapsopsis dulcis]|uniref:hypothetical protein n=1 Tax=Gloeocapsopsis dulcis TaxID=2859516 RepID=UPI0018C5196F|nr:hypothetical protein [Gloeocapsopsis dulcis]WNN87303.1 hypothetical protein P0S91_13240 [Gloeocapsopsis dulcis]
MFGINWWQKFIKAIVSFLVTGLIVVSLMGCSDRSVEETRSSHDRQLSSAQRSTKIAEVSPPEVIQQLRQSLEMHRPQVTILSPQPDEVLQDTTVNVRFQVQDLPIFKNQELNLGPHLNVILDNQPYTNVYNLSEPLVFSDLTPGTHTLRVFATYPWDESFKNEGAYTQTTFHIFAKDNHNSPAPNKPLLTYNTPQGTFSAEPVLLDFYLTNAPLHLVAQENQQGNITDWRIRCTINGESFVLERWQPLYLQGFQPGRNWVQLEFIDEQGNSLPNVFNNTIRLVTYEPSAKDSLGKLVKGQLSVAEARGIVELNYVNKSPSVEPTPTPSPSPPDDLPSVEETKLPEQLPLDETEVNQSEQEIETDSEKTEQIKPNKLFNHFRRREVEPAPSVPPVIPETVPEENEILENTETIPEKLQIPAPKQTIPEIESPEPQSPADTEPLTTSPSAPTPALEGVKPSEKQPKGFFNRFRSRSVIPPSPELPQSEVIDLPASQPETIEILPQEEDTADNVEPELDLQEILP